MDYIPCHFARLIGFDVPFVQLLRTLFVNAICYNAMEEYVKPVYINRTSKHACWLLSDFSHQCEDAGPPPHAHFFKKRPYYFYYAIIYNARCHKKTNISGYGRNNCTFDNWRVKNQLDATYYFIGRLIRSICFGHYYAHHQEFATMLLITTLVVSVFVCCRLEVRCG